MVSIHFHFNGFFPNMLYFFIFSSQALLACPNIYFVPYRQDDPFGKNNSLVCDFSLLTETVEKALSGEQLQPVIL